jgi:hypothetical protein
LNFVGAGVTATDDSANGRTVVTIPGGYADPLTTKGDLLARSASATTRLAVGTVANQTLLVDSAQTLGIKWATMTAAMVTNAVDQTGSYTNPAWIVSIPWSKVTGAPSVSSYQTPWLSDIDGAGFTLKSAGKIGVGVVPVAELQVGTMSTAIGVRGICSIQYSDTVHGALLNLMKYRGTVAAPAVAQVGDTLGAVNYWGQTSVAGITTGASIQATLTSITSSTLTADLVFLTPTERMRITATGLVGIGRTPATYPLEVQGDVSVTGVYRINGVPISTSQTPWTQDIDGAGFKLKNVSGIGIGVTNALYPLQIHEAANQNLVFTPVATLFTMQALNDALNSYVPMQYIASAHSFMQGNVGIGTTSQGALLETSRPHDSGFGLRLSVTGINDVNQASAMDFYDVSNASEMAKIQAITEVSFGCNLQFWTKPPSGSAGDATEKMRITAAGNVGIGTTNPTTILSVGTAAAPIKIALYDGGVSNCYGIGVLSGILTFGAGINSASGTPQMTLDTGGRLGLGLTASYQLQLSTDSAAKPGTNAWTVASDERLKRNIQPFTEGLGTLLQFDPLAYEYNGLDGTPEGMQAVGLSAQQAANIYPPMVKSHPGVIAEKEVTILDLNNSDLTWMMVNAFKQVDLRLKALEGKP